MSSAAAPATSDATESRWRMASAIIILIATVLTVVLTRGTGNAEPANDAGTALASADQDFLQKVISMDEHALALYVLLRNDSPLLAATAQRLTDSHRLELDRLRVALTDGRVREDVDVYLHEDIPGLISGDDLVTVHTTPAEGRDTVAIEMIYQHLTQSSTLAAAELAGGSNPGVKDLAKRLAQAKSDELAMLANLPTAA